MEEKTVYKNELRRIQLCELELIHLFVEICEKEHLMYYMIGGTMLGAIRHKGYIPWDDDADFGMPRPDYETFIRVAGKYMPDEMKVSMIGDDEWEKGDKPYQLRLINMQAKFKRNGSQNSFTTNAWIDIFPMDGMPNQPILNRIFHTKILFLIKLYNLSRFDTYVKLSNKHRPLWIQAGVWLCSHVPLQRFFSVEKQWRVLDKALKKQSYDNSDYMFNAIGAVYYRERFKKTSFGKENFYQFEDLLLRGPEAYDAYLTQIYGDYMTPPPESERNKHGLEL